MNVVIALSLFVWALVAVASTEVSNPWEAQLVSHTKRLMGQQSECVPDNTIFASFINKAFLHLFEHGISNIMDHKCFFRRFMIITIDHHSHQYLCKNASWDFFGACIAANQT